MKRLTEWRNGHGAIINNKENYIDKLAAYEDAEEDGRLVVLPCKIGDTIYHSVGNDAGNGYVYLLQRHIEPIKFSMFMLDDNGKLRSGYYVTREEAEAALAAMGGREDG